MVTTRDDIVRIVLGFNGTCNGQGYNCPNVFSADLGRPTEAWCGDFVTDVYKRAQVPLPSMQPGYRTGFAYCPDAVDYGRDHGVVRNQVVHFGGPAHPAKTPKPAPTKPRLLMLKSPMMTGADVLAVQRALNQHENAGLNADRTYGPSTRDAVMNWQRRAHIEVDGIVGPQTMASLGL